MVVRADDGDRGMRDGEGMRLANEQRVETVRPGVAKAEGWR